MTRGGIELARTEGAATGRSERAEVWCRHRRRLDFGARQQAAAREGASKLAHSKPAPLECGSLLPPCFGEACFASLGIVSGGGFATISDAPCHRHNFFHIFRQFD